MNRKIFSLLITGLTGVSVAGAVISTNVGVDALKFGALRADNSVTLLLDEDHAAVTSADFGETTVDWGTPDKSTRIYYSSAKSYDGGVCVLANGATIKKANNAPSYGLSTFAASGAGELEIKTYFNDSNASESTYVYNYTLGENEITAYIVGNYFEYNLQMLVVLCVISIAIETCIYNKMACGYLGINLAEKSYFDFELEPTTIYAICLANIIVCGYLTYKGIKIFINK